MGKNPAWRVKAAQGAQASKSVQFIAA